MGIMEKLSGLLGLGKEMDLETYMSSDELEGVDVLYKGASQYVKPVAMESEGDLSVVENELSRGNIILLNVSPIAKQQTRLKNVTGNLKSYVTKIDGDIARIGETLILLTPKGTKIIKKKKGA
jgi:SepF-like predicted cell division protein (DUF552 family)